MRRIERIHAYNYILTNNSYQRLHNKLNKITAENLCKIMGFHEIIGYFSVLKPIQEIFRFDFFCPIFEQHIEQSNALDKSNEISSAYTLIKIAEFMEPSILFNTNITNKIDNLILRVPEVLSFSDSSVALKSIQTNKHLNPSL